MAALAASLDSSRARGTAAGWNAEAEQILETLMYELTALLAIVGLSLHHGLGGHVGTNETSKV
jgi:type IV secretory pathway VirB2 component (pilin)